MEGEREEPGRGWPRVTALLVACVALSVLQPGTLIAVPFLLLMLARPALGLAGFLASALAVLVAMGGGSREGAWFLERGWAVLVGGWFLALTLRWPGSRFISRALGAVAGAFAVAGIVFGVRPRSWDVVDFMMTDRIRSGVASAMTAVRSVGGDGDVPAELVDAVYRTAEAQGVVFPALVGLSSVAALGVAWWAWVRLARDSDQGLGPLKQFRFNDQLVWVFIAGLVLVLASTGDALGRTGTNAVVFMGALYALRGAAVLIFLSGGISLLGSVLLALAFLFVAPVLLAGAMVVGLGDTWLDLRKRARALMA